MTRTVRRQVPQDFKIRFAEEKDTSLLLEFIKKLADYEKKLDQVVATEDDLREIFFKRKIPEAIICEYDGKPAGFAVFFYNFSTFMGSPGLYIEDIYVNPELRGKGAGTLMFAFLAELAIRRKCGKLEWTVLHWNKPSIDFYKKIGAVPKEEWKIYKLDGTALKKLAEKVPNHL